MIEGAALHVYIMDVHVEPTMMLKDPMKWYKLRVQFKIYLKL